MLFLCFAALLEAADESVVRVLSEDIAFAYDPWLTAHREVRTVRRVRAVFDLLAEMLQRK